MPTPLPGTSLKSEHAATVFAQFIDTFRDETPIVDDVPTHCHFRQIDGLFWGHVFDVTWIPDDAPVVFFEEQPRMQRFPQDLRQATMRNVREYFKRRERWEFSDTYIFNAELTWCIVVTHDDVCRYADLTEAEC
jgi:hypothetical protein